MTGTTLDTVRSVVTELETIRETVTRMRETDCTYSHDGICNLQCQIDHLISALKEYVYDNGK